MGGEKIKSFLQLLALLEDLARWVARTGAGGGGGFSGLQQWIL